MIKVHFQSGVIDHDNNNNSNNSNNKDNSSTNSNGNNNSNNNGNNCLRYGFDSKTSLDAFGDLLKERSQQFSTVRPRRDLDVWKRKPPDFTPRVYNPKPPKRNTREAIQPWKYVSASDQKMLERKAAADAGDDDWKECCLPEIFKDAANGDAKDAGENGGSDEFVTRFKTAGLLDAKVLFVRNGMCRRSAYRMPKPHDFRGLPPIESLGLPEFSTKSERDPYNLKFNKENPANVLRWSQPQPIPCHDDPGSSVSPMTPPPKWDRKLILPKTQWPNKYAAYTRHRRWDRSAYSAKMERIEQQLTERWKHESIEGLRHDLQPTKSRAA